MSVQKTARKVHIYLNAELLMVLIGTCPADVDFQPFDPDLIRTCWALRRKGHWLPGPDKESGLTDEELRLLVVQCLRCKRLVSRTSHHYHRCPQVYTLAAQPNLPSGPDVFFEESEVRHSPGFRLDALGGETHLQYGLTNAEFEELFFRCMGCNRYVTAEGRYTHLCFYSDAEVTPDDKVFQDLAYKM